MSQCQQGRLTAESPGRVLDTLLEVWGPLEVLEVLLLSLLLLRCVFFFFRFFRLWAITGQHSWRRRRDMLGRRQGCDVTVWAEGGVASGLTHMNPRSSVTSLYWDMQTRQSGGETGPSWPEGGRATTHSYTQQQHTVTTTHTLATHSNNTQLHTATTHSYYNTHTRYTQ